MKKYVFLIILAVLASLPASYDPEVKFIFGHPDIIAQDGTRYIYLASEGPLYSLGSTAFLGKIRGDLQSAFFKSIDLETGMYSCEVYPDLNILKRLMSGHDFAMYYRKESLTGLDLSPDNCVRFEFIELKEINNSENYSPAIRHIYCDEGIKGKDEIQAFLADLRSQKSPMEAGLYDLVTKPDGAVENCYVYGYIYGYFSDINLAIRFRVMSYDDKAYSADFSGEYYDEEGRPVDMGDFYYVLPEKWLDALQAK